jgi:hypothetical protein
MGCFCSTPTEPKNCDMDESPVDPNQCLETLKEECEPLENTVDVEKTEDRCLDANNAIDAAVSNIVQSISDNAGSSEPVVLSGPTEPGAPVSTTVPAQIPSAMTAFAPAAPTTKVAPVNVTPVNRPRPAGPSQAIAAANRKIQAAKNKRGRRSRSRQRRSKNRRR